MTEDFFTSESTPRGELDADGLLIQEMNRMSVYRVNDKKQYCSAVEGFIEDCPAAIRDKGLNKMLELGLKRCDYSNITDDKFQAFCDLKIYTFGLLERNGKIFKMKKIKTYE